MLDIRLLTCIANFPPVPCSPVEVNGIMAEAWAHFSSACCYGVDVRPASLDSLAVRSRRVSSKVEGID